MRRVGVSFRFREKVPPYERALRLVGLQRVPITPDRPVPAQDLDGLLLSGGSDIDPTFYGQPRDSHTRELDPSRDELELKLLGDALDADLPILGICRGMQLFNVFHGGTSIQFLQNVKRTKCDRNPSMKTYTLSVSALARARRESSVQENTASIRGTIRESIGSARASW